MFTGRSTEVYVGKFVSSTEETLANDTMLVIRCVPGEKPGSCARRQSESCRTLVPRLCERKWTGVGASLSRSAFDHASAIVFATSVRIGARKSFVKRYSR